MSKQADNRSDFIKRLFAVSVSVGFATQLAKSTWIEDASFPSEADARSLVLLLIAVGSVIGSWEGYFASLADKPLERVPRFLLDILIVFEYLVLMLSSAHVEFFLIVLLVIFATYLVWDYFSILEFKERYEVAGSSAPQLMAFTVFLRGLSNSRPTPSKGPSITLFWFTCLLAIFFLGERTQMLQFLLNALAVGLLLLFYRLDKHFKFTISRKLLSGASVVGLAVISTYLA